MGVDVGYNECIQDLVEVINDTRQWGMIAKIKSFTFRC